MNVKATEQQIDGRRRTQLDAAKEPQAATSSRTGTSPRPTRTTSSSASSGATPTSCSSITAEDLPESFRVVPKKAELTETVKGEFSTQQGVD